MPDSGEILWMPDLRLGYIEQHDAFEAGETVIGFLQRYTGKPDWECAKVASQFQLKNEKLTSKISALSGGWQMRVKLTATLLFEPNLLLLDEPTNYLDLTTLMLLENFLTTFKGTVLVITHDREFIKKTCTSTLDVEHGQLFLHHEPLEKYLEFKEERENLAASVNVNIERKQKQLQIFVDRFGAKASMAKSAQSKLKQIVKLDDEKLETVAKSATVKMYIPPIEEKAGVALECKDLTIGYLAKNSINPVNQTKSPTFKGLETKSSVVSKSSEDDSEIEQIEVIETNLTTDKIIASSINLDVDRGIKVAILGDNGQGKSTFLKTMAGEIPAISGICEFKKGLKIAHYHQHVAANLDPNETVFNYIKKGGQKEEVIYRVLANFLFKKADYLKQIKVLSGGEKARLCLAGMFLSKADVYLLDEPTNHLDFATVEAMGKALGEFNGTVFVISHNRTFVSLIASQIWEVGDGNVKRILGSYEDYLWAKEQEVAQSLGLKAKSKNSGNSDDKLSGKSENDKFENMAQSLGNAGSGKNSNLSDKEKAKKLYETKKEFGKLEKKMKNVESKVQNNEEAEKNQAILEDLEIQWLEMQSEIESLS